jgi:hypothetical protein
VLHLGRLLTLPKNIRLGCEGMPGTNALVYYEKTYITAVNLFITLDTGYIYLSGAVVWNTLTALYRFLYIKLNNFMTKRIGEKVSL